MTTSHTLTCHRPGCGREEFRELGDTRDWIMVTSPLARDQSFCSWECLAAFASQAVPASAGGM